MNDTEKNAVAPAAGPAPAATPAPAAAPDDLAAKANDLLVHGDGTFARGLRWYGMWLTVSGWLSLVLFVVISVLTGALVLLAWGADASGEVLGELQDAFQELPTSTLVVGLSALQLVVMFLDAFISLKLGKSLRRSVHRGAAVWSRRLMWIQLLDLSLSFMLMGFSWTFAFTFVKIAALVIFSIVLDPTIAAEKHIKHEAERAQDLDAAKHGMLGRDLSGKGYLRVDFYNLFWTFFVCCILGLILEVIWHMTVVEPGKYQDRAGLLIGPFSPIYGFGAVLVTLALNRLYNKNPLITFVIAGLVGGGFEWATAFFMEASFGITAWNYSTYTYFGLMPDPVAVFTGGRTATMFLAIWGLLGLVWVKFVLPIMLKGINVIPWDFRWGLTAIVAVFMIADGLLTLGSLDCWYERASGLAPSTPVESFFAAYCDDEFMEKRFQSMEMNVDGSTRKDTVQKKVVSSQAQGERAGADPSAAAAGEGAAAGSTATATQTAG